MIVDTDSAPGKVVVRDAKAVLNLTLETHLTPDQARTVAAKLEAEGEHTVAAEGLRRAADEAEKKSR